MPTRSAQIDADLDLIKTILRFPPAQRMAIVGLLHECRTHRELAERDGITRAAHKQRIRRARHKARPHGVDIPNPRRNPVKRTLAEAGRLARK